MPGAYLRRLAATDQAAARLVVVCQHQIHFQRKIGNLLAFHEQHGASKIDNRAEQFTHRRVNLTTLDPGAESALLHRHSRRAGRSFLGVNCAALPEGLVESTLFGHERGAFTGATDRRLGRFELAHTGTLFLGLQQMGAGDVIDALRRVTCDPNYRRCVEWLGTK